MTEDNRKKGIDSPGLSPSPGEWPSADGAPELARELGRLLTAQGLTLALAESCTGGLIGDLITDISGSSNYFLGSAVTYAYSAKEAILGVRHETLAAFGAVSPETAAEMAHGARRIFGADLAVAVTGIAGPTGGLPGKPVGLVFIHLSGEAAETGERWVWNSDRVGNKRLTAEAVLRLLIRYLGQRTALGDVLQPQREYVGEPVLVEARFRADSRPEPVAFSWRGRTYQIVDTGRTWDEEIAGKRWQCYLVRTAVLETFELRLDVQGAQWVLARIWPSPPSRSLA